MNLVTLQLHRFDVPHDQLRENVKSEFSAIIDGVSVRIEFNMNIRTLQSRLSRLPSRGSGAGVPALISFV